MSAFLKKFTRKGTWRQVFICLRPPIPSPSPPLLHTIHTPVLIHTGKEGRGGRWTSEKVRGTLVHKRGRKYQHDWLYFQSINSINSIKAKTTFRVWCLYKYLVHVPCTMHIHPWYSRGRQFRYRLGWPGTLLPLHCKKKIYFELCHSCFFNRLLLLKTSNLKLFLWGLIL